MMIISKLNAKIIQQLQKAYKQECPARVTIYKLIQQFKSDRQCVFDRRKGNSLKFLMERRPVKKAITVEYRITITVPSQGLNLNPRIDRR